YTEMSHEQIHEHARQPQLQHSEPAIGSRQRQHVIKHVKRVERRLLSGGEERNAAELVRIPQRKLALRQIFADERLPLQIFQHEVGEQRVVGNFGNAQLLTISGVGLPLVQVFCRKQGLSAHRLLPEHDQRQHKKQGNDQQVTGIATYHWVSLLQFKRGNYTLMLQTCLLWEHS